jgi:hypothetical protein
MPTEIDKSTVIEIIRAISKKMKAVSRILKDSNAVLGKKNVSEIVGKIAEGTFAEILTKKLGYPVRAAQNDKEPDLFLTKTGEKMEIKMTSTDNSWQGGEFSTRPYEYFLISWGGDFDEFFVARATLSDKEWHSNIANRRYGTTYPVKDLYNKADKIVYLGSFKITDRGAVKLIREKIL